MNVQGVADQAGRLIEGVQRQARDLLARNSDTEEPTAGALWKDTSPVLEKALAVYDRQESPETPERAWVLWRETKKSCQQDIEEILDTVLAVLGTCGAAGYRTRIRNLQADNTMSQTRITRYRELMLSAPAENSQNFVEGLIVQSKENLTDCIADETDRIAERTNQIESLKGGFREHLQHIGLSVPPELAESFLLPVVDDVISMAAVISNISRITEQLQMLVDASKEAPAETRRYYGIYVLLVFAVDRLQTDFLTKIDELFLPRIAGHERDAVRHIADAEAQIKSGGPHEQLTANIAGNNRTIEACRVLDSRLRDYRQAILDDNRNVRVLEAAAVNTYRTVCLSLNVAELIGYCDAAFRALRELRLPPLRPFQGIQLTGELQKLAERVVAEE
jgi:hypothetical protein